MELNISQETIERLIQLPLANHHYEIIAGNRRKDGKFPVYIKDVFLTTNGNYTYWTRRAPKQLLQTFDTAQAAITAVSESVYLLNRRKQVRNS